jgi:hypothetical protein
MNTFLGKVIQECFHGNGWCLQCRHLKLIEAALGKYSDETPLGDQDVGHKPGHYGYSETRAHRVVGYKHVTGTDVPQDADRLIVDRPVVEIGAGEDAAMVRKLCHRPGCSGALEIIWRGDQPHVDALELAT